MFSAPVESAVPVSKSFATLGGFLLFMAGPRGLAALPYPVAQKDVIAFLLKSGFIDRIDERTER